MAPDTVEFPRRTFAEAGRPVLLAPGNHDWYGPGSPYARAHCSPNVHVFSTEAPAPVDLADGLNGALAPAAVQPRRATTFSRT